MSVLEQVLKEELGRLERNVSYYEQLLSSLPRGSIFIRKIGSSSFAYRKRKENGMVVSVYLGNLNQESVQNEIELSEEYKRIKGNLRIAKQELYKLRKAVKVYG